MKKIPDQWTLRFIAAIVARYSRRFNAINPDAVRAFGELAKELKAKAWELRRKESAAAKDEYRREWSRAARKERAALGMCQLCGKNQAIGARCENCRKKRRNQTDFTPIVIDPEILDSIE
jgi:hypothetical protein